MGIEPTSEAWEASILPLYDARSSITILLRVDLRTVFVEKIGLMACGTSTNSAFFSQVDYFRIARDPGVVWRIHYEPLYPPFSVLAQQRCCVSSLHLPLDTFHHFDLYCVSIRHSFRHPR
jgi:hypothetical protein